MNEEWGRGKFGTLEPSPAVEDSGGLSQRATVYTHLLVLTVAGELPAVKDLGKSLQAAKERDGARWALTW